MSKFRDVVVVSIPFLMFPSKSLKNFSIFFGIVYTLYAVFVISSWIGVEKLWSILGMLLSLFLIICALFFSVLYYIIYIIKFIRKKAILGDHNFLWQSIFALFFIFLLDNFISIEVNWSLYVNETADFPGRLVLGDYFFAKTVKESSEFEFKEGDLLIYNDENFDRIKFINAYDVGEGSDFLKNIVAKPTYVLWSRDLDLVGNRINK